MIYDTPSQNDHVDQGDLIDGCPVAIITHFTPGQFPPGSMFDERLVIVLTQTCDLVNDKTTVAVVAEVQTAQSFVDRGIFKPADIKGPLRSGRIWGVYFLPADATLRLPEMIIDFRRLHTVKVEHLLALSRSGKRPGRVRPPYREHLAKYFADGYCRIGLPKPYETL